MAKTIGVTLSEQVLAGLVVDHKLVGELQRFPADEDERDALIDAVRPTVVCCTPTYALRLAEVAGEERRSGCSLAASGVRVLIVAGEPGGSIPATRQRIERAWGARLARER